MPAARRAFLLISALAAFGARAAEEPVMLNFVNADIEAVAGTIGQMSQRNFLIDPRVKGTVNIVSSRPVPPSAAYDIFLSALRLQGYATVEGDGVVKILPEADAKLHLRSVAPRSADGDRLVTRVYALKYESASQLLPVLRPIISPNNPVAVYAPNNTIVITDYADNLRRIDRIIDAIDRPGTGGEPVLLPLRHAAAADIVAMVNRVYSDGAAAQPDARGRVTVAADSRTNSVIVRADNPARLQRIQEMVQHLDSPTGAAGNIHVVYLKNAEAVRVAQTLRAVLSGEPAPMQVASAAPLVTAPAGPGQPVAGGPGPAPASSAALGASVAGGGMVQADAASNAVIISAPDAVYANLRAVIDKLDVRRAQVHVEALIVEITADKAAEFGVQWQSLHNLSTNGTQAIGGTNFGVRGSGTNILDAAANLGSVAPGLNIGIVRGTVTIPGVGTITNLAALARALEADANANILSDRKSTRLNSSHSQI